MRIRRRLGPKLYKTEQKRTRIRLKTQINDQIVNQIYISIGKADAAFASRSALRSNIKKKQRTSIILICLLDQIMIDFLLVLLNFENRKRKSALSEIHSTRI